MRRPSSPCWNPTRHEHGPGPPLGSGEVQGVAYRWSAQGEARRLGLIGWVKTSQWRCGGGGTGQGGGGGGIHRVVPQRSPSARVTDLKTEPSLLRTTFRASRSGEDLPSVPGVKGYGCHGFWQVAALEGAPLRGQMKGSDGMPSLPQVPNSSRETSERAAAESIHARRTERIDQDGDRSAPHIACLLPSRTTAFRPVGWRDRPATRFQSWAAHCSQCRGPRDPRRAGGKRPHRRVLLGAKEGQGHRRKHLQR